jgi:flagellar protein FlgJ
MHDQQLSMELSQSGALGLADIIVEQLSPTAGKYTPASLFTSSEIAPQQKAMPQQKLAPQQIPQQIIMPQQKVASTKPSLTEEPTALTKASALTEAKNEPKADPSFTDENSFVQGLWQHAKQAAEKIGLNPAVMLAQAALETGWGKHVINKGDGQSSNNLFNIKADKSWQGDKASKVSLEFEHGVAVKKQSQFRAYNNVAESFNDFIDFLQQNPRYQGALNTTQEPQKFLQELQQAGYATDPNYANKIIDVLKRSEFSQAVKSVASELDIKQMINHTINSVGGIK